LNSRVNCLRSMMHLLLHKTPNSVSSEPGAAQLAESRLQRSLTKTAISTCLQTLNAQYDQQSEKWRLVSAEEQVLDEEDSIDDSSNFNPSPPVSNSILKIPFPFLRGL
jgi:hypothetical protein